MADLKFGNVTPAVGNIKLGSNNVSEIYQGTTKLWPLGTPPTPGEVTVCDLIWTKTNSTITATTTGGNIPIVTNQNDWITKCQNNDPAACYWQFDSNNAFRGLYYNVFATEVIQPPTGFRVPTQQDWQNLIFCAGTGSPDNASDVTSLANNYYGFWPSNIASNSRFGTVDFNSIGAGYTYQNSTTIPPAASQGFTSEGIRDIYHQQQPGSLPASYYPVTMFWRGPQSANRNWLIGYSTASFNDGFQSGKNGGALMRFVKDLPTVELYDNDTQTGPPVSQLDISFNSNSGGGISPSNFGSLVVDPSGTNWSPSIQTCVNQTFSGTNPIMRIFSFDVEIFSDANRTNLVATFSKNFTGTSDQTVACSTPTISTFSDQAFAGGTYYIKRTITFNTSGSLGTPPFTYTFLLE